MRGAKGSPYEGGHRVPLFAHWPKGGVTGGRDVPTLTAHIDLLPTMLDLCGLKRPNLGVNLRLHGRSLRPLLLQKKDAPWPERTLVTDSQRLEKLVPWRQAAVMTSQWRLVNASPDGDPNKLELYDILKDPGQKQNVAQSHPQVVNKLKQDYEAWWKQTAQRADQFVRIALGSEVANPVHRTTGMAKAAPKRHGTSARSARAPSPMDSGQLRLPGPASTASACAAGPWNSTSPSEPPTRTLPRTAKPYPAKPSPSSRRD
jgi:arylsulfatase B